MNATDQAARRGAPRKDTPVSAMQTPTPLRVAPRHRLDQPARERGPTYPCYTLRTGQPRTLEQVESDIRGMVGPPNLR